MHYAKGILLLQEFSGSSQIHSPAGKQIYKWWQILPQHSQESRFPSLGLEKSWFPILFTKSNSSFRDASFLMHTFLFFLKSKCTHIAAVTLLKSSCPSTQENWSRAQTEPLRWTEGNKLLPQDREGPLGVSWAAVEWAGLSCTPLCFPASLCYQFTLSSLEHRSSCEFRYYSPLGLDHGHLLSLLLIITYYFTTPECKYLRPIFNFIFGSVAYNSTEWKNKIFPAPLTENTMKGQTVFLHTEKKCFQGVFLC